MKVLLTILMVLIGYASLAQLPSGFPTQKSIGWFEQGYQQSDSATIIALRDTSWRPRFPGTIILWRQVSDTSYFFYTGTRWVKLLKTGDTPDLAPYFKQNGNLFATTATLGTNDNNPLVFETNNIARGIITTDNKWGIGTTTPTFDLEVKNAVGNAIVQVSSPMAGSILDLNGTSSRMNLGGSTGTIQTTIRNTFVEQPSSMGTIGSYTWLSFLNLNQAQTSGNGVGILSDQAFTPASGNATHTSLRIGGLINQTGGASGTTYGIRINPVITNAANFNALMIDTGYIVSNKGVLPTIGTIGTAYVMAFDTADFRWKKILATNLPSSGGGGNTNSNIGSGYRWAVPGTNNIKTVFLNNGLVADSSSNANTLTFKLGQDSAAAGAPASLQSTREIPLNGFGLYLSGDSGRLQIGLPNTTTFFNRNPRNIGRISINDTSTRNQLFTVGPDIFAGTGSTFRDNRSQATIYLVDTVRSDQDEINGKSRGLDLRHYTYINRSSQQLNLPGNGATNAALYSSKRILAKDSVRFNNPGGDLFTSIIGRSSFEQYPGYVGTTRYMGTTSISPDAVTTIVSNVIVRNNNIGTNVVHAQGWYAAFGGTVIMGVRDTIDNLALYTTGGVFGSPLSKVKNWFGYYIDNQIPAPVDNLYGIYQKRHGVNDAKNYLGHRLGIGIGKDQPVAMLDINGSIILNKDSVPIVASITSESVLLIDTLTGNFRRAPYSLFSGSTTPPAGSNTQVQYNNAGAFGAEAAFTYNATNNLLTIDSLRNIRSQTDTVIIGSAPSIRPLTMKNTSGAVFINTSALGASGGGILNLMSDLTPTAADQRIGFIGSGTMAAGSTETTGPGIGFFSTAAWTVGVSTQGNVRVYVSTTTGQSEVMRFTANQRVGVRVTNPQAALQLPAGAAAAGGAPLMYTAGTNLTTAAAGAEEYDGTSKFFTPGSTRLRYVLTDNTIPSNGQLAIGNGTNYTNAVPAAGTSGTDFAVATGSGTLTFNLPVATTTALGKVSITAQTFGGQKTFNDGLIAQGTALSGTARVRITGNNASGAMPTLGGVNFAVDGMTYTDGSTAGSGTVSTQSQFNYFGLPLLAATNTSVTYTDVSNVTILEPQASTNVTISRPRSLYAAGISQLAMMANDVSEGNSGTITLGKAGHYIFNGTTVTATLPDLATYKGGVYFIKNAGSGNITLQRAGSDQLYDTGAVTSITIAPGAARIVVAGSNFWYVE